MVRSRIFWQLGRILLMKRGLTLEKEETVTALGKPWEAGRLANEGTLFTEESGVWECGHRVLVARFSP
jgi:hypothetical protein